MIKCLNCNNKITSKHAKKFCSSSCSATYNNKKFPKRQKTVRFCLNCNSKIESKYAKKFCGNSCSSSYNKGRSKKIKFCLNCGKELNNNRNKCCSRDCDVKYRYTTITFPKIIQGLVGDSLTLKKFLRKEVGDKCSMEGCNVINEWNGKYIVLELDHIDGNSDNNLPSNLRLLCPNCHSQTPTYANKLGKKKNTRRNRKNHK